MKRKTPIIIVAILLLTIAVVGSTYAFFSATASTNNSFTTNASKFQVIYTGGTQIEGPINFSTSKVEETSTTVNIRMGTGSVSAKAILYIEIEEISPELAVKGFVWEVYGYQDNQQVYHNDGNFYETNNTTNKTINIVENYQLSEVNTEFKVYLWLDGNKVGNEVMNSVFRGFIGAKTENFSGNIG